MSGRRHRPLIDDPVTAEIGRKYDEFHYTTFPFPLTLPNRIAVWGQLNGMRPQPASHARVLELGCNDGANLVPMAAAYPQCECVGVDIAHEAIARGVEHIRSLGITNARLIAADVRQVDPSYGQFDYIICHGLYSWVPADVRDRILAICHDRLSERGIAYISYSTLPGGYLRHSLRDMMLFHTRRFDDSTEKVREAKAFLGWLVAGMQQRPSGSVAAPVMHEADVIRRKHDSDVVHDSLAAINEPVYFTQFMEQASRHGLQFLAEAEQFGADDDAYEGSVGEHLRALAQRDIVLKEQYLDFLEYRFFRKTLLVHREVELQRVVHPNALTSLWVGCSLKESPDSSPDGAVTFRRDQAAISITDPHSVAAVRLLADAYPASLPFVQLLDGVLADGAERGQSRYNAINELARIVRQGQRLGVFDLSIEPFPLLVAPSDKPRASAYASSQIAARSDVTNLRHEVVLVDDPVARQLLPILDGTRDRDALVECLASSSETDDRESLAAQVETELQKLGRLALLEA